MKRIERTTKLLALFTILMGMLFSGCDLEPSEADIRIQFTAKRPVLERLVEMSNEDFSRTRITRIAPEFTRLENNWGWPRPSSELGISQERWDEYRKLFGEAEVLDGIDRSGESYEDVMFSVWGFGIADNSHSKGFIFCLKPPTDVEGESQRIKYERIAENWYYFDWTTW